VVPSDRALRTTLSPFRNGTRDPTTRLEPGRFVRATLTPDGPGTLEISWSGSKLAVRGWGPGGEHLVAGAGALIGGHDAPPPLVGPHHAVARAQRHHPDLRLGASGNLYHELLPAILAQRITGGEAVRQWRGLCEQLGEPAPGPHDLRLPPRPERLAGTPTWWFHPLGIERRRAAAMVEVARHASKLWGWAAAGSAAAAGRLSLVRGVGEWTIGVVLGIALGEPDAVAVGDYHLKNIVAHALAGEPRATDERMLELLEPYRGQRGRVVRLLVLDGHGAPAFGPRRRILPMHRW